MDVMYYAARSDWVKDLIAKGLEPKRLWYLGPEAGILLFHQAHDAETRCGDCFGEFEDEAHVLEVDVTGLDALFFEDFDQVRKHESYTVFGPHTFFTQPIGPERIDPYNVEVLIVT